MDQIEAMPLTNGEKKRLIKEWLRSRLAEMPAEESNDGSPVTGRLYSGC